MRKNKITAVLGPTNTGKTFLAIETMLSFDSGMMGFPLRLLAREVYDKVVKKIDPNFTRFNVFLRDKFSCQYCGSKHELTFDHLLPRSKGGKTDWDNVVTACSACNVKKGGRLLEKSGMKLNQRPFQPTTEDLHKNGRNFPPNFLHKSWMDYLYWDVELEP